MSDKAEKAPEKVTVYMVGNSRGNEDGQRRVVDAETADFLVTEKHARRAGE